MFDSLEIYNGGTNESSSRVAKLCGSDLPEPIESSGKELILRFQSDSSLNIKGFKLRFASTGVIFSCILITFRALLKRLRSKARYSHEIRLLLS